MRHPVTIPVFGACVVSTRYAAALAIGALAACSSAPSPSVPPASTRPPSAPSGPGAKTFQFEIANGKHAEECFALDLWERIEFRFEASTAVDYDLHTHRGSKVVTEMWAKGTRGESGAFTASDRQEYCMLWTNTGAVPAHVRGEWKRLRR